MKQRNNGLSYLVTVAVVTNFKSSNVQALLALVQCLLNIEIKVYRERAREAIQAFRGLLDFHSA